MSNQLPATLTSLTFASTDLQRSDLSLHLDIVSGLNDGLTVRGEDTLVPGMAGRLPRNRVADVREIILAGTIQGVGVTSGEAARLAAYQDLRDELEALFSLTAAPAALAGDAADGTSRTIDARTALIVWDPSPFNGVGTLSVTLVSVDPDWQVTEPIP